MDKIFEPLKTFQVAEAISELQECLTALNEEKFNSMHGLHDENAWETSIPKIQSKINQEHANSIGNKIIFQLSDGLTATGTNTSTPRVESINLNETVLKFQALANKESSASAWLTSNPAYIHNQMSDEAFNTAFHIRNLFPVMGSRKWCFCGEKMDCLGWHVHHCKDQGIKNPLRNDLHEKLKTTISNISQNYVSSIQMVSIHRPEPRLERFFKKINPVHNGVPTEVNEENRALSTNNEDEESILTVNNGFRYDKEKIKADIGIYPKISYNEDNNDDTNIEDKKAILIDVTSCCPIAQRVLKNFKPGRPADHATKEKINIQYKHWNIQDNSKANLLIFAIDSTTGTVGKEGKDFLKFLSQLTDNESSVEVSRMYGRISTAFQANRAYWISKTRSEKSFDEQPQTPTNPNRRGVYPLPLHPPAF